MLAKYTTWKQKAFKHLSSVGMISTTVIFIHIVFVFRLDHGILYTERQ